MRTRKLVRGIALALTSAALAFLAFEGALRFVMFSDFARERFGWRLRNAGLYTSFAGGRENWKLRARLAGPAASEQHPAFDARTGWLKDDIDPSTLAHRDEGRLAGRVPVLLFGDSYAECVIRPEECWQGLLERSELGATHALLNYGVSGYGLDQMYLLLQLVLAARSFERQPVVAIGILVDDDLDRCYLPVRSWPKPTFDVADGALVLRPLEHADAAAYLEDHPLGVRSWLWRLCARQSGLVPERTLLAWAGEADHLAVKHELAVHLVRALDAELASRDLAHFFVLFHGPRALASESYGWQEPLLLETFRELGIPFVSSRRYLRAEEARTGSSSAAHFIADGPSYNHYTAAANALVFQALADGLAGRFER